VSASMHSGPGFLIPTAPQANAPAMPAHGQRQQTTVQPLAARILAGAAPPDGVRANPAPGQDTMTLCTFVANLTTGEAALLGRGTEAVAIPLADLAQGRIGIRRAAGMPSLA
jgi:hypothetical protein